MEHACPNPSRSGPIAVAVRELVGFLCRSGSLDSHAGTLAMNEGTRLHNILQSRGGAGYIKEVSLQKSVNIGDTAFILSGRADGIIDEADGYCVDEIKTTGVPLAYIHADDYTAYWAQAECYAWIFAADHKLENIRVRITFCHVETEEVRYFYRAYTFDELNARIISLLTEYKKWALLAIDSYAALTESAAALAFPFRALREGQEELILAAHRAFKRRERLFAQAPTGIGKTMSTLYPAVRALGEGIGRRIFYLTAKTTTRTAAMNAVEILRRGGLSARSIVLTAKEKLCRTGEVCRTCDSLRCPYSDGHYDRVNGALWELLAGDPSITREAVEAMAEKHRVCPYELSLDAALWCDIIVGDYNYLFDPRVYLRRFFSEECPGEENLLLVDEAHNLPERAREMFSATLHFAPFFSLLCRIKEEDPYLYAPLRGLCRRFLALKRRVLAEGEDPEKKRGFLLSKHPFEEFDAAVGHFAVMAQEWLAAMGDTPITEAVREARIEAFQYARLAEEAGREYVRYAEVHEEAITVRLLCLDPAAHLGKRLEKVRGAVFFSATLTPTDYFADILGGGEKTALLELGSPFPRENLFVGVMDKVSTRYADRERTPHESAQILAAAVQAKKGNYIVYFPSYSLLKDTWRAFRHLDRQTVCIAQKPSMTEAEREAFLSQFGQERPVSMLAFCVLGGIFSEGIDLTGDKLIGSIIVGTGIGALTSERNVLAEYYEETRGTGFDYAYTYPGMNKVLQAAGRVIRTESDRGIVLLIDDRFGEARSVRLFPRHWRGLSLIGDIPSLQEALRRFWEAHDRKDSQNEQ